MTTKHTGEQVHCPVDGFQHLISGKYKLRVLWQLRDGPKRYGEIRRQLNEIPGRNPVTARVLSRELKALAEASLIVRKDFGTVPPKVEYRLSAMGQSLIPVVLMIHDWGVENLLHEPLPAEAHSGSRTGRGE